MTVVRDMPLPVKERRKQPLRSAAQTALNHFFDDLDGDVPENLYDMMIGEMEHALFGKVMERTRGNQSKAAAMLGINRTTLRKKLRLHGLID